MRAGLGSQQPCEKSAEASLCWYRVDVDFALFVAYVHRYDIYTYSRPHHPLALLGYPVVRMLQQRFRRDSLRSVARAAACEVVDSSLDDETRRRLEQTDFDMGMGMGSRELWWWPFKAKPLLC